ncbi:MAG TPA: PIG-L deacetylase family protein [Armatimonadota bacterium]|jgi:LmbE family N-acetylglucosaminyl deacetylase
MSSRTILAICAHPDDAEFRCGGTLLLLAKRGWDIHVATLSAGDCGSAELPPNAIAATRRAEAQAAAKRLGGTYHCLGGQDLQIYDDNVMRGAATALIREINPNCIITHFPVDYMPDHDAASAVARCASFTATLPNYVVGPAAAVKATEHLVTLYYFTPLGGTDYFGTPILPQFYVDVTTVIEEKAEALACHASQRDWLRRQHGIDQYIEQMREWDAEAGQLAGVNYAEGFLMHKGHAYPQTPFIEDALAGYVSERK